MNNDKSTEEPVESPKVALTEQGIVVKNRAFRRAFRNRAMLEGRKTKHWYTKSHKKKGRK